MRIRTEESGFSAIELVLVLVFVGVVGFVGWYVHSSKQSTDKVLSTGNSSVQKAASSVSATATATAKKSLIDTTAVQSSVNDINSSVSQLDKDINSVDSGLNDASSFTSVPQ